MAGSVIGISNYADASIIYTDVNPDQTISGSVGTYTLDLNNDATPEFGIQIISASGVKRVIVAPRSSSGNQIAGASSQASAFNVNANINSTLASWATSSYKTYKTMEIVYSASSQTGPWKGVTNKYLGLKFVVGGNTYYGWARLDVTLAGNFTIKDYAYNNVAGQGILAGQNGLGLTQFSNSEIKITAFEKTAQVILGDMTESEGTIIVSDMEGREIKNIGISQTKTTIDLQDVKAGIYFIAVRQKNYYTTKKIAVL